MKKSIQHKAKKWVIGILLSPFVLFLLLAVLLYLPPVQNFVVHRVAASLSESTGMNISVSRVRLSFPLDLSVKGVEVIDGRDTIVSASSLYLDVRLKPLFEGRADIDGFSLYDAKVNSKHFISNTYIRGKIGRLQAAAHGVEWTRGVVKLNQASLDDADLYVALSDTAREEPDTVPSMPWRIVAEQVTINRSRVSLSMPGDSMRLMAEMGKARLEGGLFDTGRPYYSVRRFNVEKGGVVYATLPSDSAVSVSAKAVGNAAFALSNTLLWKKFRMEEKLSADYIAVSNLCLQLDTLSYDEKGTLRTYLAALAFNEHSGLKVENAKGRIYMDTTRLFLPLLEISTPASKIKARADLNFNAFTPGRHETMSLALNASLASEDVRTLAKGYADDYILEAFPSVPLTVEGRMEGNISHLSLSRLHLAWPQLLSVTLKGSANDIAEAWRTANFDFETRIGKGAFIQKFLPLLARGFFDIPNGTSARGDFRMKGNRYATGFRVNALRGWLGAKADVDFDRETYALKAVAHAFPLGRFLPGYGLGDFSGTLQGAGRHFDLLSAMSSLEAKAQVDHLVASGQTFSGLSLKASSRRGQVEVDFASSNALLEANGKLTASLGRDIEARLMLDLLNVDLKALGMVKDTLQAGLIVDVTARTNRKLTAYSAQGGFSNIHFSTPTRGFAAMDLNFDVATAADTTTACITAGDLDLDFGAKGDVDHLMANLSRFSKVLMRQLEKKKIDQEMLRRAFPVMKFHLAAGRENPLSRFLFFKGIDYQEARLELSSDPLNGMGGRFDVSRFQQGNLQLDTIHFALSQDTAGLNLDGTIRNYLRKNPNKFTARLSAYIHNSGIGSHIDFTDSQGRKGIDLGLRADFINNGLNLSLSPNNPIIAYRRFNVNDENFIFLGKNKDIKADMNLLADDGTALSIYSTPADSVNDITLSINNLNLGELSNVMPYLPKLEGMLSGDMHVMDDHQNGSLSAAAQFKAKSLVFEDAQLGNVGMEAFYMPQGNGKHYANAYVSTDTLEVLQCEGTYDDNDGSFDGVANLHDCPLRLINGFLVGTDVAMRGEAGGELHITGTADAPVLDGALAFDDAHLYSEVYGFDFLMDPTPVEIRASQMNLKNYALRSAKNENPLLLNGTLDMRDFSRIGLNFSMRANNFELINAKRNSLSLLYGKVYANYLGTLKGTSDNISIRGKLEILDRTDMTYILKDSPLTVDDRLHDLVQFVSFRDSATVEENTPLEVSGFDLTLGISISDAARFRCSLSEDGQNYVNLEGGGDLTMRLTQQGDMRLTGRFTANSGEMKYSLPIIPLKTFNIVQGSYVDFTGDMMNPTLNITAKERVRATVVENDQPRTVPFDVGVQITQPLNNMGLTFIIEATEDLTVQNQLATMSADQRSKTAVAMLATGMYVTDDMLTSGGSGFKASNALNAFLQSEIQNIAGSALKTIDLSIGMENNTSAAGTETTDYSFQFAKRFWNNRISVIIGGKVSTGEDAQNSAESFIDNVAIEYRLDKSATRYVKVFYDRSTRDPLEGQLTQTGAGLVLRRKTDRLGELFIFKRKKKTDVQR